VFSYAQTTPIRAATDRVRLRYVRNAPERCRAAPPEPSGWFFVTIAAFTDIWVFDPDCSRPHVRILF
jgi:hypothetical protein